MWYVISKWKGFEEHTRYEHNQWAYVFFFIHLDETLPNDYTALELFISRMVILHFSWRSVYSLVTVLKLNYPD